jgi:hypothetical protein
MNLPMLETIGPHAAHNSLMEKEPNNIAQPLLRVR